MIDDKPRQKDVFVLDVIETSKDETKAKADAVKNFQVGEPCGPTSSDATPPPGVNMLPTFVTPNPQQRYNRNAGAFSVRIVFADGHHGPDRDNLTQNDPGTTENPQHEHDDYKRPAP